MIKQEAIPVYFMKAMTLAGFSLLLLLTGLLSYKGKLPAAAGVMIGGFWAYLSGWVLSRLLSFVQAQPKNVGPKVFWLLVIKFPVLYLCGYFILISKLFPVLSLLTGLSVFVFAFVLAWFLTNVRQMRAIKRMES